MNYAFQPDPTNSNIGTVVEVERCINKFGFSQIQKTEIRGEVSHVLKKQEKSRTTLNNTKILNVLRKLKKDKSIVILRADKGNTTVIMDRVDYNGKITKMLHDGPYKTVKNDPTMNSVKQVKQITKRFLEEGKISKIDYKVFNVTFSQTLPYIRTTGPFQTSNTTVPSNWKKQAAELFASLSPAAGDSRPPPNYPLLQRNICNTEWKKEYIKCVQ